MYIIHFIVFIFILFSSPFAYSDTFSDFKDSLLPNAKENVIRGDSTFVTSQGRWIDHREEAKRNAIREAQRNYAETTAARISGFTQDLENEKGQLSTQNFNRVEIDPTTIKVSDVTIIKEETRHENSWMWNQEWRFTVKVKVVNQEIKFRTNSSTSYSNNEIQLPESEPSIRIGRNPEKASFDNFKNKYKEFREKESSSLTPQEKVRYTLYAGAAVGVLYVTMNPWLLYFL